MDSEADLKEKWRRGLQLMDSIGSLKPTKLATDYLSDGAHALSVAVDELILHTLTLPTSPSKGSLIPLKSKGILSKQIDESTWQCWEEETRLDLSSVTTTSSYEQVKKGMVTGVRPTDSDGHS